jgi:hypothetical protein
VLRTTAPPTARLTTNPVRAGSRDPGRTSRCPVSRGRPVRLPPRTAAEKSSRRRIRAAAGSKADLPGPRPGHAGQTLIRARPLRRRADRTARPALVRMRSLNPCVLARRRLFGWNVRLLTGTPGTDLGFGAREGDKRAGGIGHCGSGWVCSRYAPPWPPVKPAGGPARRAAARQNRRFAERPPAPGLRLWTTLRPGVAGAGHAGPVHRHSSRAIRAHRDIRRAQPVDKAVDHIWGREGWTTNE